MKSCLRWVEFHKGGLQLMKARDPAPNPSSMPLSLRSTMRFRRSLACSERDNFSL